MLATRAPSVELTDMNKRAGKLRRTRIITDRPERIDQKFELISGSACTTEGLLEPIFPGALRRILSKH